MRKTILLINILILLSFTKAYTQDIKLGPPNPEISQAGVSLNANVNLYSGTLIVDLPICNAVSKNLNVPIGLKYDAGGIRVQDISGWVGLGMRFCAGGSIKRSVVGLPDDLANGYCGTNDIGEKAYLTPSINYVTNTDLDREPDIFYFEYLNTSGRFILDEQGNPVLLPHANLKIEPAICKLNATKWVITDSDGIKYTFGIDDTAKEDISGVVCTWYLSEIELPRENEKVQFSYESGNSIKYSYYNQIATKVVYSSYPGVGCKNEDFEIKNKDIEITINAPKYLRKIVTPLGSVEFIRSDTDREDLSGGKYLEKIIVADFNSNIINTYKLQYSYFLSDNCSSMLCKRLRLDRITESEGSIDFVLYSLHYNALNLPSRDSHCIDHWGYYNSNTASSKIPTITDNEPGVDCFRGVTYPGADRSADEAKSQACILKRIDNRTGSFKEFEYSAHEYFAFNGGFSTGNIAGGARIKNIKECVNENECKTTSYSYSKVSPRGASSGFIYAEPHYESRFYSEAWGGELIGYLGFFLEKLTITSYSLNGLFDLPVFT